MKLISTIFRINNWRYITFYIKHPIWLTKLIYLKFIGVDISWTAKVSPKAKVVRNGGIIKIGKYSQINDGVILDGLKGEIHIGDYVSINYRSIFYGGYGLKIGNFVRVATGCTIIPTNHRYAINSLIKDQGTYGSGIVIGDDVWIGADVTILDGVSIQSKAIVGAKNIGLRSNFKKTK